MVLIPSGEADPRVQEPVEKVDDQVEEDDQRAIEDDDAEDERVVAVERSLDEMAADPGNPENLFDDDRAGDDPGGGGPEIAHDRQHPGAHGVTQDGDALRQSLGPGGADEVRAQDLDHAGPGHARDIGDRSEEHTSELQSLMRSSYAV